MPPVIQTTKPSVPLTTTKPITSASLPKNNWQIPFDGDPNRKVKGKK